MEELYIEVNSLQDTFIKSFKELRKKYFNDENGIFFILDKTSDEPKFQFVVDINCLKTIR